MTVDEFIAFMKRQQGDLNDKQFADLIGVTPQYICDIYGRRRIPGDSVTEALSGMIDMRVTRSIVYTINPKEETEK